MKIITEKQSKIEIKKSKFLGFCFVIKSEEEFKEKIAFLKKEYKDARHFVWAYRFQESGVLREKYTDDKEPSGSAGKPLLFLLQKKEAIDCAIVVVRYFGGVKLGVGGLMRAYTESAQAVLVDNLQKF
ncbi:YigZ family protein [Candidatus Nomurabacteria bacterium]|nr:YigZ family protein [Candidatus Nomurabacteria bacterium]